MAGNGFERLEVEWAVVKPRGCILSYEEGQSMCAADHRATLVQGTPAIDEKRAISIGSCLSGTFCDLFCELRWCFGQCRNESRRLHGEEGKVAAAPVAAGAAGYVLSKVFRDAVAEVIDFSNEDAVVFEMLHLHILRGLFPEKAEAPVSMEPGLHMLEPISGLEPLIC